MRKVIVLLILVCQVTWAGNSKILGAIKDFLPNFTEIGFVTNLINVYFQVSQFVRSTNKIVSNMKAVKNDIAVARKEILQIYNTCQSLKNISLYDMDTWASTVQSLNWVVSHEIFDVVGAFNMLEYHTVDATVDYLDDLETISEFDIRKKRTEESLDKYFLVDKYADELKVFNVGRGKYYKMTLITLQNQYTQKQLEYIQTGNEEIKEELDILQRRIRSAEKKLQYIEINIERLKIDTLIEEAKAMTAMNLTEIQEMEKQVKKYEEASANMIDAYNKLKNNQVSTNVNKGKIITDFKKEGDYGDHPNQIEEPKTPDKTPRERTQKKRASSQDVISLQNGIACMLLKQECLMRDITAMKCNTMAFILAHQAFMQDMEETQGVIVATHSLAIKEFIEKKKVR